MTDSTAIAAEPGDAIAFDLLDSDPRQLAGLTIQRRLRPGSESLAEAGKPVPFLAVAPPAARGDQPQLLTVKVARQPLEDVEVNCLKEEEQWARAEELFHSSGRDAKYEWVARSFIQGTPMNELDPQLPAQTRQQYAELLLAEIERMHASGETHLDIKPSNVIITPTRTWLIDFESSRLAGQTSLLPMLTTTSFASPEQVAQRPDRPVSAASDIFSWALTVISMFKPNFHPYCRGPFDLAKFQALDTNPAERNPIYLHLDCIPDIGLQDAVRRALTWEASNRPTAAELRQDLNRSLTTIVLPMPPTRVVDPAEFQLDEPFMHKVQRIAGPAGPLGDKQVPGILYLATYLTTTVVGLMLALILVAVARGAAGA